jgi:hypothetical protein
MERQALRRLAAHAGKFFQLVDETSHGFSEARHFLDRVIGSSGEVKA